MPARMRRKLGPPLQSDLKGGNGITVLVGNWFEELEHSGSAVLPLMEHPMTAGPFDTIICDYVCIPCTCTPEYTRTHTRTHTCIYICVGV